MPNRRPVRVAYSRGKRRATEWVASADQGSQAVASNTKVLLQSFTPTEQQTIIRSRGIIYVAPAAITGSLELQGAFGIAVVSNQALAAGAASIPGPWTEASWDGWLAWVPWAFRVDIGAGQATGPTLVGENIGTTYQLDSKAMRKVELNESIVIMAESQVSAVNVTTPFRMLFKLV